MQYGHHGRDLLLELKRSEGSPREPTSLPMYNDTLVSAAQQDLKLHVQALNDQVQATSTATDKPSMEVRPSLLLQKAAVLRNKRCLLAYHRIRMQRIQDLYYWQQESDKSFLCPAEGEFLEAYTKLIDNYTSSSLPWNDLRAHALPPQQSDRVQVRIVNDESFEGPIVLESGTAVVFTRGSIYHLLWNDVEEYIRNGSMAILEGEGDD